MASIVNILRQWIGKVLFQYFALEIKVFHFDTFGWINNLTDSYRQIFSRSYNKKGNKNFIKYLLNKSGEIHNKQSKSTFPVETFEKKIKATKPERTKNEKWAQVNRHPPQSRLLSNQHFWILTRLSLFSAVLFNFIYKQNNLRKEFGEFDI